MPFLFCFLFASLGMPVLTGGLAPVTVEVPTIESTQTPVEPSPAIGELPVSIARIQRALARPSAIRLNSDKPVFRVEVLGRKPTIADILGPNYQKGAAPYGGMTHSEFLNMVTPKDVQGYAAFSNGEAFTVAATSLALQWALQKAVHRFETAKKEREREAARVEVQDALAALAKARQKAGLPPK